MKQFYTFWSGILLVCVLESPFTYSQSIDEIIASSYESVDEFDRLADLSGLVIRQELDMMLLRKQAEELGILNKSFGHRDDPTKKRKRRKAIRSTAYRWTNKVIPYTIANGVFSKSDLNVIKSALEEWQTYTCIKFKPATRNDNNKIHFDNGNGCFSYVGMIRSGSQKIGLAPGCRYKGVVIHEVGHAVGFYHEQNRPDRDSYVKIMKTNIPQKLHYNFKKYSKAAVDTMDVPYDYGSVMHYGGMAFSMNRKYTIKTLNSKDQTKIGNRKGLSYYDIMLANKMYKCNDHCKNIVQCPKGTFMGKDCKCWCPGYPVNRCASTGTIATTTSSPRHSTQPPNCEDKNKNCPGWAAARYCGRNTYVKTYCKKSCGLCSGTPPTTKAYCQDQNKACPIWGRRGYCQGDFEYFMTENCPKTCKSCGIVNKTTEEDEGDGENSASFISCGLSILVLYPVIVVVKNML